MNRQIVLSEHVKNINDIKLLRAGWIYDINFEPTFRHIRERGYLKALRATLPETQEIRDIFDVMDSYINEREKD